MADQSGAGFSDTTGTVGGHAVAYYGHPRATKDLDVLVRPTPENAERVYRALASFGAPDLADAAILARLHPDLV